MTKAQWRAQCLAQRQQISAKTAQERSAALCDHLATFLGDQIQVVFVYLAFRQEPDLRPLLASTPHIWTVPRTVGQTLTWHRYDPERLINGKYGIQEPKPDCPRIDPAEAQLVLVPALACDHQGFRLGYGGGYYDRFLASYPVPTLGVCFCEFVFPEVPRDPWDQPLGGIATELGVRLIAEHLRL